MKNLTFKHFLHVLDEGTDEDISKLQADISLIDTTINQRTLPLVQRKNQLQKLLMQKQKQRGAETKRPTTPDPNAPADSNAQQQQQTNTTTPGSLSTAR